MSLNTENLYVLDATFAMLATAIQSTPGESVNTGPIPWIIDPEPRATFANPKRKLAISGEVRGWRCVVESSNSIDIEFAARLSERRIVALQVAESVGALKFQVVEHGRSVFEYASDTDDDVLGVARELLRRFGVPFDVHLFGEVVILRDWTVLPASRQTGK